MHLRPPSLLQVISIYQRPDSSLYLKLAGPRAQPGSSSLLETQAQELDDGRENPGGCRRPGLRRQGGSGVLQELDPNLQHQSLRSGPRSSEVGSGSCGVGDSGCGGSSTAAFDALAYVAWAALSESA